jgi:serine/threonine-protein kinase
MPRELALVAAERVGLVGLLYSAAYLAFELVFSLSRGSEVTPLLNYFRRNAVVGILMGLAVWWLSRRWRDTPGRVVQVGLVFEVVASLHISMAETTIPFQQSLLVRGHSSVAFFISVFALVAPVRYGLALTASLLAAAMTPLGIAINMWRRGNPNPPLGVWVMWSAAPFLMAVLCTWIAKWIYQMGQELEQVKNLGSYQLIEQVGQGGMGEVWRAKHRYLAREAAVKLIGAKGKDAEETRKRFEREAQAIARLESPHTVSIFDYGVTPEGQLYFAMELIRGMNLDQLVKRFGPLPNERVRHIWLGVLRSLEEAHAGGLVHRDIKPSNVLLARMGLEHDWVKVVDFGLVKMAAEEGATQITMDQQTLGTPAFMAPELAEGDEERIDGRADLYSSACVAYWLLTGRNVFSGPTAMATLLKHLNEAPEPPSQVTEMPVDGELERLVMWCLAKKPGERPSGAKELREALEAMPVKEDWGSRQAEDWWKTNLPALA